MIAVLWWFKGQKSVGRTVEIAVETAKSLTNPQLARLLFSNCGYGKFLSFTVLSFIIYNNSTVILCATKVAVWVYSHAAYF